MTGLSVTNVTAASAARGWLVSLSIWRDEKALIRWRTHALHHEIQGKGRASVFAGYHLRVGEITIDTQSDVPLPQSCFDTTEVSASKAVTLTERTLDAGRETGPPGVAATGSATPGFDPFDFDTFDSITRPGNALYLCSWLDPAAAEAGISTIDGRHRVVRVIRDYGMFARTEAPEAFRP